MAVRVYESHVVPESERSLPLDPHLVPHGTNQFPCAPAPRVCSSDVIYNKLDFLMRNYGTALP